MAAFSHQTHQSLLLDSTLDHMQHGDLTNATSPFPPYYYYYSPADSTTSLDHDSATMDHNHMNSSVEPLEQMPPTEQVHTSMEKKRKNSIRLLPSTSPLPATDKKEGKRRKQRRPRNGVKEAEKSTPESDDGEEKQQPPTGYIHVRARRGQATDSHSLAERVRREKISERMKLLQGLVPGCDKVIGKALMLDEIINYVQSLQNQVEFLSMKLASANPSVYEFGVDLDGFMVQPPQKQESMTAPVASVHQTAHIQPTAFVETTDNYPIVETSVPFLLHGHGPTAFPQEHEGFVMHMDEHNQRLLQQFPFSNMCTFQ